MHRGYRHDGDTRDGSCTATFAATLEPGRYKVQLAYTAHGNRASNVPVRLRASREVRDYTVDQRKSPNDGASLHTLDTLMLGGPTSVIITNRETDGHVIVDAVRFVKNSLGR